MSDALLYSQRMALAQLIDNWYENNPKAKRCTFNDLAILDSCDLLNREECDKVIDVVARSLVFTESE